MISDCSVFIYKNDKNYIRITLFQKGISVTVQATEATEEFNLRIAWMLSALEPNWRHSG